MTEQRGIIGRTIALNRRYGMLPDVSLAVNRALDNADDWYRFCKRCDKQIYGTKEQVLKPCTCDGTES